CARDPHYEDDDGYYYTGQFDVW
nr:immunoglobulin heavy chain junction region [Macaca mulatta]MOV52046.1 immunoglobulin heavy chain junction region [Macaca mulatta]